MNDAGHPDDDEDDLTAWEKLQVSYIHHTMTAGKVIVEHGGFIALIDNPDRLNEHATPDG